MIFAFPRLQRRQSDDEFTQNCECKPMIMNCNRIQSVFDGDDEARNNNIKIKEEEEEEEE